MTLFYAVVDPATHELAYVSAGHPAAIRLGPATPPTVLDAGGGMPIGLGGNHENQSPSAATRRSPLPLLRWPDRGHEFRGSPVWSPAARRLLQEWSGRPLRQTVDALVRAVEAWCGTTPAQDDISVISLELRAPSTPSPLAGYQNEAGSIVSRHRRKIADKLEYVGIPRAR